MTASANRNAIASLTALLDVGRNPGQSAYLNATVAELALTNTVLSSTDRSNVKSYVNARYGLSF